jgi:DNA-binding NtrC family response regulator
VSARSREIGIDDLPDTVRTTAPHEQPIEERNGGRTERRAPAATGLKEAFAGSEREILARYAETCDSAREIARLTGLHHTTTLRKLRKYRIRLIKPELLE